MNLTKFLHLYGRLGNIPFVGLNSLGCIPMVTEDVRNATLAFGRAIRVWVWGNDTWIEVTPIQVKKTLGEDVHDRIYRFHVELRREMFEPCALYTIKPEKGFNRSETILSNQICSMLHTYAPGYMFPDPYSIDLEVSVGNDGFIVFDLDLCSRITNSNGVWLFDIAVMFQGPYHFTSPYKCLKDETLRMLHRAGLLDFELIEINYRPDENWEEVRKDLYYQVGNAIHRRLGVDPPYLPEPPAPNTDLLLRTAVFE